MGEPVTIADPVGTDPFGLSGFSLSASGRIAYRSGGAARRQLVWFDRTGRQFGVVAEPDPVDLISPELSPDGHRLAVNRTVQGNRDVWLWDLVRGGWTRFTFDPAQDGGPSGPRMGNSLLSSPDGKDPLTFTRNSRVERHQSNPCTKRPPTNGC
jgi:hypothetical protein